MPPSTSKLQRRRENDALNRQGDRNALTRCVGLASAALAGSRSRAAAALAQKKYDPGATDTEIKIGNTMPYSGPASAYGTIGKTEAAYFKKINDEGGINGRKINFITYDDGYSPPKTVEQARKLVESDEVLLVFKSLGTPPNSAIHKYMNTQEGAAAVRRDRRHQVERSRRTSRGPWAGSPTTRPKARIYAKYILKNKPNAKIGILYQNDDYGKDYLKGFKDGLGAKAATMIVAEAAYETHRSDHRLADRQPENVRRRRVLQRHDAEVRGAGDQEGGRDRLEAAALPQQRVELGRHRAQAGRPRGRQGIISSAYLKDPTDPQWKNDAGMKALGRLHGQVLSGGRQDRRFGVRLHRRPDASCRCSSSAATISRARTS